MNRTMSRRELLVSGVRLSMVGLVGVSIAESAGAAAQCVDPKTLDSGAASLRASLHYTEASADASQTCAKCAFYQGAADGCGTCQIFSGPANSAGRCDSWGAKS
jgi:High potential iron-sulfur protein